MNIGVVTVILLLRIAVEGCLPLGEYFLLKIFDTKISFQDSEEEEVVIANPDAGLVVKAMDILMTIPILRHPIKLLKTLILTNHPLSIFPQSLRINIIQN